MPIPVFIDTGAFYAMEDRSDEHHQDAVLFRNDDLSTGLYDLLTTSYVIDEALTLVRKKLGIPSSIAFCRKIRKSRAIERISVTPILENKAMDLFEKYNDKDFSFTDCVSFISMREYGIREVFGFDEHFRQMGFEMKPGK